MISQPTIPGAVTARRTRRWVVIVALATLLVTLFALRAVVHHMADDATSAAAITTHHEDAEHGIGLDVAIAVAGVLLVAVFLGASRVRGSVPRFRTVVSRRLRRCSEPLPSDQLVTRARARAELQCFLT